jgi:hypothetical protein
MRTRRQLVTSFAVAALIAGLFAVISSVGRAGSSTADFSSFAAPTALSQGATGFAGAKFTPTGGGAATHVVITLTLPAVATGIKVTACAGKASVNGQVAECDISSIQSGETTKVYVTFTASSPGSGNVAGLVTWDAGNGSNGAQNLHQASNPTGSFTVYPTGDQTHAGTCSSANGAPTGGSLTAIVEPTTGKGIGVTYKAASVSGFPCTPAQIGVDNTNSTYPGMKTPGLWSIVVAQAAPGALADATLTVQSLKGTGLNWQTARLLEILADGSVQQVQPCTSTGGMPAGQDMCIAGPGQSHFGQGGVQWPLKVLGTGIDPRGGF